MINGITQPINTGVFINRIKNITCVHPVGINSPLHVSGIWCHCQEPSFHLLCAHDAPWWLPPEQLDSSSSSVYSPLKGSYIGSFPFPLVSIGQHLYLVLLLLHIIRAIILQKYYGNWKT